MPSKENAVIVVSALVTVAALGALQAVEATVGMPADWAAVVAFLLFVTFGYVAPQAYLLHVDDSVSSASRMGVVVLMLVLLSGVFAEPVSGIQQDVIWGTVVLSVLAVFAYQAREGYRQSVASDSA
jgi:hypothetical protein